MLHIHIKSGSKVDPFFDGAVTVQDWLVAQHEKVTVVPTITYLTESVG